MKTKLLNKLVKEVTIVTTRNVNQHEHFEAPGLQIYIHINGFLTCFLVNSCLSRFLDTGLAKESFIGAPVSEEFS